MPGFSIDADRTPFGKNVYKRSTRGMQFESYMCAQSGVPTETIDGEAVRVLQPGTVMARITAVGVDQDKVGVYDTTATDGRQTAANIVGVLETFLPWQMDEGDREVSVMYHGTCELAKCFQYTAGVRATLTQGVADNIRGTTNLDVLFV